MVRIFKYSIILDRIKYFKYLNFFHILDISVSPGSTVFGKQKPGESLVLPPSKTKLVDIQAPDLSYASTKLDNNYSRSITLSTSQSFAGPEPSLRKHNNDRSAVVRAVVSVADSDGNLIRRGTVTDITNE